MPATTFMERSRASLEYARQTVGTVSTAFRHRAASFDVCSFNCWVVYGEEPTRFSRSFTASAQSLSARRIDINGSGPSSPENTQQVRYSADGEDRIATPALNGLFVKNRDPLRDEEFHSLSSGGSSLDGKRLKRDSDPLYLSSHQLWARNNGGSTSDVNALRAREEKEEMEEEEFPVRRNKKAKYATTDTRTRPQIKSRAPEEPTSTHKFDAALHLAWLLTRGSRADIPPDAQEKTSSTSSQQQSRRRRRIPGEAERRKGRVFDEGTDYTQPPPSHHNTTNQRIVPHPTCPLPEQRPGPGLIPARKALPKPPPAGSIERIPVKVMRPPQKPPIQNPPPAAKAVTETRNSIPQKRSPISKKAIRISMFHPIVGGLDHEPSPLQQLPRNIISTSTITTPTTFPYLPPSRPSHPQHHIRKSTNTNTNKTTKANKISPSTNLILTDAEFPRQLSRDGPGSRFPSPLLSAPTTVPSRRRQVGRVPEVVLTSPTDTSCSVRTASLALSRPAAPTPSNHLPAYASEIGSSPSQPDDGRVYVPYSPAKRQGVWCGEGIRSESSSLREKRYVAYRPPIATPPPDGAPPPIATRPTSLSSATTASKRPTPSSSSSTSSADEDDVIKQAVALNLIHFHSPSPPSPSSSTLPPSSTSSTRSRTNIQTSTNPSTGTNTNIQTRKEIPSPPPSILSNSSSIRRIINYILSSPTTSIPAADTIDTLRANSVKDDDRAITIGRDTKRKTKVKAKVEYKRLTLNTATWKSFASGF
ncbi:MAG: hypothetical protein Q9176_005025 [Flavoplaca citrina]